MGNGFRTGMITLIVLLVGGVAAYAANIILTHKPGIFKMTAFGQTGEKIPLNGPVIHVFSKSGNRYDAIGNENERLTMAVQVGAICERRIRKMGSASVNIEGVSKSVYGGRHQTLKRKTVGLQIPFTLPHIVRKPAAACNYEMAKRAAQSSRSEADWMKRGFVVKYEDAYSSRFTVTCTGAGRDDFGQKTIGLPVWIACDPLKPAKGKDPKQDKGKAKPEASRPRPPPPLKITARLEADHATHYAPTCPTSIRFTGSIWSSRPGVKLTYQVVGTGWTSPKREMKFAKAGRQEIVGWSKRFDAARPGGRLSASKRNPLAPDVKGKAWIRLQLPGSRAFESKKLPYQVFCNRRLPKRSRIKPQ